jgi:hypothetical protein
LSIHEHAAFQKREYSSAEKQLITEEWLIAMFMDKLRKASIIAGQKGKPFVLYRNLIEENEDAVQEEVGTVLDKYVVVQIFTYGGFIPSNFQKQQVFTLDKFTRIMLKRNRNFLLQCLENLDIQAS